MPNDGGHAFPVFTSIHQLQDGMTLLDYFAGQALMGLCAHPTPHACGYSDDPARMAQEAYEIAARMIEERERQRDE